MREIFGENRASYRYYPVYKHMCLYRISGVLIPDITLVHLSIIHFRPDAYTNISTCAYMRGNRVGRKLKSYAQKKNKYRTET